MQGIFGPREKGKQEPRRAVGALLTEGRPWAKAQSVKGHGMFG